MANKYDMTKSGVSYSGNPGDDLHSFISKFNYYATLRDFTDSKKLLALNTCLSGHARVFLDTVDSADKDTVV